MAKKPNKAFSLVELSIVILIIGVLIAAVGQGVELFQDSKLSAARIVTQSSRVSSLKNLILWFETTSIDSFGGAEPSDGDQITNWRDINPQSNSKLQTTTTSAPTYKRSCINGLPCLSFNGTANYLDTTTLSRDFINSRQISAFAIFMPLSLPSGNRSFITTNGSWVVGSFDIHIMGASFNNALRYELTGVTNSNSDTKYVTSGSGIKANTSYVLSVIDNGTTANIYFNGGSSVGTASTTGSNAITNVYPLNIGYFNNAGNRQDFFNGYISELIIFDRALTTKERLAMESYLGKKWNIKVS